MTINKAYLRLTLWLSLAACSGCLALFSGLYLYLSPKLPAVETLRQVKLQTPLRVYSSDKVLIGEFGEKRRTPITYHDAPELFVQAILAAEDDRFYSHHGVDIKGLLRAASQLLQSGHIQTGGSTITMQVARNFFLTRKQTFTRKFNEILLALQIERELSKEEILELYMNKIYLGNRAYGIQAAAQAYYGKNISELDLAQLAMIAGLPKAPSAYNPIANPSRAKVRRNWILGRMLELDYIDNITYQDALKEPVTASYHGSGLGLDAPYIAEMARKKTVDLFGEAAYTDGYQVYTSINSELQASAQKAVINGLLTYDSRHGFRGPETSLPFLENSDPDATGLAEGVEASTNEQTDQVDAQQLSWQTALKNIPTYAGLKAAVVILAEGQQLEVMTAYGDRIVIPWDNGPSSAKPHISENRVGRAPKTVEDFLTIGDVVRIAEKSPSEWHLSQIPVAQAALVALNPEDGGIQALVGGLDFRQSHFNRATQAERQPGSNFKPFIYTAALENGLTPATVINDAPIVFDDASLESTWRPENASGKFFGPTRLRQALFKSRNLVSIRVLRAIGTPNAINGMARFGFEENALPHDLSLALGSHAMPPLQVATAYAVFANGGYQVEPYLIDRITDATNETLYQTLPLTVCRECEKENENTEELDTESPPSELPTPASDAPPLTAEASAQTSEDDPALPLDTEIEDQGIQELIPLTPQRPAAPKVLDPTVAYIIDNMLRDVIKKGTGRRAQVLGRHDLAGKTGTTNGPKDAWFSGYNGHMVATTWLGFDQNLPLGRGEYGGSAALPIWIDFMRTALDGIPETIREQPDGLITVRIDPETGLRANPDNPDAIFEIFRAENAPALQSEDSELPAVYTEEESLPDELF